jgi:hypothetical protein
MKGFNRLWHRQGKQAVLDALRRGERPDLAPTAARGPLDELLALHEDLGILHALDRLQTTLGSARSLVGNPAARRGVAAGQLARVTDEVQ